jgi:hypothetical protein
MNIVTNNEHQSFACNNETEEWIDVPFNKNYQVSTLGRVFSKLSNKVMKQKKNNCGYLLVRLSRPNKYMLVHRIVMLSFRPDDQKTSVNHIDLNKENNTLVNLEWASMSENLKHYMSTSGMKPVVVKGEQNGQSKLKSQDVLRIVELLPSMGNKKIADIFFVSKNTIKDIRTGKSWSHLTKIGGAYHD